MRRDIITVERVAAAHAGNEKTLSVRADAVVTPSAHDAAAAYGIKIVRDVRVRPVDAGAAPQADLPDVTAEVKRRVIALLPPEKCDDPLVDQLVAEALKRAAPSRAPKPRIQARHPIRRLDRTGEAVSAYNACFAACRNAPKRIVFPDALDPRVLRAAARLQQDGLASPVLLGNPEALRRTAVHDGIDLAKCVCVDHESPDLLERNTADILKTAGSGKVPDREEALRMAGNRLIAGALMVRRGEVDLGIGGNLSSTAEVIRAGLRIIGLAEGTKTVFGLFFMISPHDGAVWAYADCAVIIEPTESQLADIAIGAADALARLSGGVPRVALLSFSTRGSASHPMIGRVRRVLDAIRTRREDLLVDGEMQFDAAVDLETARRKAPESPVAGRANVFVFPGIEAGNIAYKVAQRLGGFDALGPFLVGFAKGWHDLSRGCSTDDIVKISVLGSALEQRVYM